MVPGMNEPLSRYDVTVIVDRGGGYLLGLAEFAVAAEQADAGQPSRLNGQGERPARWRWRRRRGYRLRLKYRPNRHRL